MMACEGESSLMSFISSDKPIALDLGKNSQDESSYNQLNEKANFIGNVTRYNFHINFKDIIYSVREINQGRRDKEILHKVNGYFRASSLTAIVGPSGAGKSSLLNVICGLKTNIGGTININEIFVKSDVLRKIVCYVPQEFSLLPWLTTEETLYFAARLKIIKTKKSFKYIVNKIADEFGLLESLYTMAEKLSGGEKRRLNIAMEVVAEPLVLVLDEPTSGLDSMASDQVICLLNNMAQNGCTVVCTIHQPSSKVMTMFNDVLVMAEGREIYCGPQSKIIDTFEKAGFVCPSFYNIGEFVIEVASGQRIGDIDELRNLSKEFLIFPLINSNSNFTDNLNEINCERKFLESKRNFERHSVPWKTELHILLWRAVICVRRDCTMTQTRLAAHIIVGCLLGLVFRNFGDDASKTLSNIACLFFFLLFLFFANAMPAVQMFPVEAAVFAREHSNNWYRLETYYISKIITDLPLQLLCPTVFLITAYSLTGQPLEFDRFSKVWIVCFLLSILAQAFGILTGAAFNTHIGCFLVPALNIPMFLFAGFFLKLNETPSYLKFIRTLSYFRYAFEGILQAIYGGSRKTLKCPTVFCIFRSPKLILSHMNMPSTTFIVIIMSLLIWILCLHIIIYIILRWKIRIVK